MMRIFEYYGRYQGMRERVGGLPAIGRVVLFLAALPGLVLLGLSILALGVSILALLLLTVPVYRLLLAVTGGVVKAPEEEVVSERPPEVTMPPEQVMASPGRRHVEVKIIDETQG